METIKLLKLKVYIIWSFTEKDPKNSALEGFNMHFRKFSTLVLLFKIAQRPPVADLRNLASLAGSFW